MTTLHRGEAADVPRATRRLRAVAAAGAVCAGLLALSACTKPTPLSTITVGTDTVSTQAACYDDGKPLATEGLTACLRETDVKSIKVDPDETVRFGVDPDIAEHRWTILMNGQQLIEDSNKTYRTVPGSVFFNAQYGAQGNSTLVTVKMLDGKANSQTVTGLWNFKLVKDAG